MDESQTWGRAFDPQPSFCSACTFGQRKNPVRGHFLGDMSFYRRRLPHWEVIGEPLFVTFRLAGSLPGSRRFPPERMESGKAFVALDRLLDQCQAGPTFLRGTEIARLVVAALHSGDERFGRYELHSFVVMPNHVHMLVTPNVNGREWLGPLKGFTAHEANKILKRHDSFWQPESYDHLVRDRDEFYRIRRYIENNPVRAGLCANAEAFPWSSAHVPDVGSGF